MKIKLSEILDGKHNSYQTTRLLKRLVDENIKEYLCEECGISNWINKEISLQLHHIDGIEKGHVLSNLQILCPNCHSQKHIKGSCTKKRIMKFVSDRQFILSLLKNESIRKTLIHLDMNNSGNYKRAKTLFSRNIDYCSMCGEKKLKTSSYCSSKCHNKARRDNVLSTNDETLFALNNTKKKNGSYNFLAAGKLLGISDNGVRKRLKNIQPMHSSG